jgi:RES domain-containing protein
MVAAYLRPWDGAGYRHIPAGAGFDVLDARFAARASTNRWNERGDPTLYLAGDRAVALAEFARHLREDFSPALGPVLAERALYRLRLRLRAVLDLRDAEARRTLGLHGDLGQFLAIPYARATATFVRRTSPAEGLLVPSMAFLDDATRWNLVLFLEKLPSDLATFITAEYAGTFRVEAG